MKKIIIFLLTLASSFSFARTLIISDIDDTIKVSHILSTSDKVSRATDVSTPFTGMAQLYQLILNENIADSKIVYLSNAPETVAGIPLMAISHQEFLSNNHFPKGELDLNESIFNSDHKITEIRRLIEIEKPDLVILVGDNGERDAEVYHQAFLEYGGKYRTITFIHQLYSSKVPFYLPNFMAEIGKTLYKEQVGYVTPVEIAIELNQQNIFSQKSVEWLLNHVADYIVQEQSSWIDQFKPISFPSFKNCGDFKWKWPVTERLNPIYQKIMNSCR